MNSQTVMNLQSIVITNCIGCAILIILMISSHLVRRRRQLSDKLFTAMIVITATACLTEMFTFLSDGKSYPFSYALDMLTNTYLYVANISASFLWCVYVDLRMYNSKKRLKRIYPKLFIPSFISLAALIFNLKWQFVFSVDKDMTYHREPIGYIYILITFLNLFGSFFIRNRYYKKFGKNKFFPIYMFLAPIFIGSMAQLMIYGVSIAWCSVSLGLVGIYMSLQNEFSYIDPLTKLYNRNYLNHVLNDIDRRHSSASGIMIDLDYFKSINDTFGHDIGDEALIEAAQLIRRVVPEDAVTVRYAGDEFIVIMHTDDENAIDEMIKRLRCSVIDFNNTAQKKFKLSFSIGKSILECGKSTDGFLRDMDNDMYAEKKDKHSRSAV